MSGIEYKRPDPPRTVVEFMDAPGTDLCHKAFEVHINGVPVSVEKDSIDLLFSDTDVTRVALTLLPTEVHFHRKPKE